MTLNRLSQKRLTGALLAFGLSLMAGTAYAALSPEQDALIKKGEYVAIAGDCVACHSTEGGKPFAGGLGLATPLGTIYSSNITPSKKGGIGNYTLEQFEHAVRDGVRSDGANLYPAMPYTSYAKISDDDMKALYAYFMQGVQPVDTPSTPTALPFPFNVRLSMAGWNLLFLEKGAFKADPSKSDQVNRGAYLGEALAHCSTCHTPRNALMAEQGDKALGGSSLGTWFAPNITSDAVSGTGNWSTDEIAAYLKTGHAPGKAQAAGPMAEAIDHSLSHLSDSDLQAIAVWLKQTTPVSQQGQARAADQFGSPANYVDTLRGVPRPADADKMTGWQVYDGYCASCHQPDGRGSKDGGLPSLINNTALGHLNSDNLVMAILHGVQRGAESKDVAMPAFDHLLSDTQVATLSNQLLQQFGNDQASVTPQRVKELRAGGKPSPLLELAHWGMGIAGVLVILLIALFFVRRRRRH